MLWALLQAVLLVAGSILFRGGRPRRDLVAPAVLCLGGAWCFLDVVLGQWDGVTLLGVALCWRWRAQDRPIAAGLALGMLGGLAKPHLLVGVAVYLLVRREWRLVLFAAAGALAVLPFLIAVLADGRERAALVAGLLLLDAATWLDTGTASLFPPGRLTTPLLCVLAGWWIWQSREGVAANATRQSLLQAGAPGFCPYEPRGAIDSLTCAASCSTLASRLNSIIHSAIASAAARSS